MSEKLTSCSTREEAKELLVALTKKELLKLAYESDIYVKSSLDKEGIIDRLIASTVGATKRYEILKGEC